MLGRSESPLFMSPFSRMMAVASEPRTVKLYVRAKRELLREKPSTSFDAVPWLDAAIHAPVRAAMAAARAPTFELNELRW